MNRAEHNVITLRPAKPDLKEGLIYARYLDTAAEGFFRLLLGGRAAEIIAAAYVRPANNYSYQNVIYAECDRSIAGMVASFTGAQRRRFLDRPLETAAGGLHLRMRTLTVLFGPLLRILERMADLDHYILAMAVDPRLRGRGMGSMLMDRAEQLARTNGSTRLTLDVAARNRGARRLYERQGLTVESSWPGVPLVPPLFVRMSKPI